MTSAPLTPSSMRLYVSRPISLNEADNKLLRDFTSPQPAREISLIYHKSQLKIQLIEALKNSIDGVIRGAISFSDVKIISPLQKK